MASVPHHFTSYHRRVIASYHIIKLYHQNEMITDHRFIMFHIIHIYQWSYSDSHHIISLSFRGIQKRVIQSLFISIHIMHNIWSSITITKPHPASHGPHCFHLHVVWYEWSQRISWYLRIPDWISLHPQDGVASWQCSAPPVLQFQFQCHDRSWFKSSWAEQQGWVIILELHF